MREFNTAQRGFWAKTLAGFMHIIVAIAFILIIGSLGSALYFMMTDQGRTKRMVWSLAARVGLSISLFLFILFAHWMGWIQSTGIPLGR
ncbi:putative transmembrane protein [Candidatus Paraburkholderia kirkii]|nr:putative transmembrane protein [Candidatus Paraburkholderia kirkii]